MAIVTHVLPEHRIALFCLKDRITLLDIADAIVGVTGKSEWSPGFRHLWYSLPGTILEYDPEHLKYFEAATAGLNYMAQGDRTAIVVHPNDVDLYKYLVERDRMKGARDIRVFTSLVEGTEWLEVLHDAIREYLC